MHRIGRTNGGADACIAAYPFENKREMKVGRDGEILW